MIEPVIAVEADLGELRPDASGAVDVFAALDRQFYWADRVMLATADERVVLCGEIVGHS
jgi:hypothetical protein